MLDDIWNAVADFGDWLLALPGRIGGTALDSFSDTVFAYAFAGDNIHFWAWGAPILLGLLARLLWPKGRIWFVLVGLIVVAISWLAWVMTSPSTDYAIWELAVVIGLVYLGYRLPDILWALPGLAGKTGGFFRTFILCLIGALLMLYTPFAEVGAWIAAIAIIVYVLKDLGILVGSKKKGGGGGAKAAPAHH